MTSFLWLIPQSFPISLGGVGSSMTNMNYQLLGRSGLRVSDLSLGTMTFGDD